MARGKLTPKQEAFVREYLVDLNATAAYRRAGYRAKTDNVAAVESSKLLRNPKIAAAIAEAQAARAQRVEIKADAILRELLLLATSDIGDVFDFSGDSPRLKKAGGIPEHARRAISSIKVRREVEGKGEDAQVFEVIEFKLWDKPGAVYKALQHLGLAKEKHEHTGPGGGPVEHTHEHNVAADLAPYLDAVRELAAGSLGGAPARVSPDGAAQPATPPEADA